MEERKAQWEVHADIYNNTFILCKETGARAWFKQESDMFYFTHFQGDKGSLLYYFFLGAFRVVFTYYKNLEVRDSIPANVLAKGPLLVLQDFLAPFFLFIKSSYVLKYLQVKDDLSEKSARLESQAVISDGIGKKERILFDIHFKDDSIEKMVIREPSREPWELQYEIPS